MGVGLAGLTIAIFQGVSFQGSHFASGTSLAPLAASAAENPPTPPNEAIAAARLPAAPTYSVLDEPQVLSERARIALETLLVEHERITGQKIVVAIFKSLNGNDLNDWTNRVFAAWKVGQREEDDGALLAVYWQEQQARIEVGYGLEDDLTDAKAHDLLETYLTPELKAGHTAGHLDRGVTRAVFQILQTIDSPLIESGRAEQIIRSGGVSALPRAELSDEIPTRFGWVGWMVAGFFLLLFTLLRITSADAHFTGQGWYRPRPWWQGASFWGSTLSRDRSRTGGDSGPDDRAGARPDLGIPGGGGSSGGGGASASW